MLFYILYIIIISLLLLTDHFLPRQNKIFGYLSVIIVILVSGFRFETGYDYNSYREIYDHISDVSIIEFGYMFMVDLFNAFYAPYELLVFVSTFLIYPVIFYTIRKYVKHYELAFILYMLIPGLYLNTLSIVRQEIAIAISFLAFYYLINKNYWRYIILMFFAFSFHYSSIFLVLFHLLGVKFAPKLKPVHYIVFVLLSFFFSVSKLSNYLFALILFQTKYGTYITDNVESVSQLKIIILNAILIIPLVFYTRLIASSNYSKYYLFFSLLGLIVYNLFSSVVFITRFAFYLRIFEILLIPELIFTFSKKLRPFLILIAFLLYFAMFMGSLQNDINAEDNGQPKMIPYKSIFEE